MKKKAFTLIELLIAVTISALIMTSILIFTWNMIHWSLKSQKILENQNNNMAFDNKFNEIINDVFSGSMVISWSTFGDYNTWIVLKTNLEWTPLVFLWLKTFSWYCDSYWQTASDSWIVQKLVIKWLTSINSHKITSTNNYFIDLDKNSIYSSGWALIIWNNIWGNNIWVLWTDTQLSNPSAIFETNNYLYIADNGNNRILSYNKATLNIEQIASYTNWISNPTDLLYSSWELYITNAWNNNIIKIKDSYWSWTNLNINIKSKESFSFDKIVFDFDWINNISSPNSKSDFTYGWWVNQYSWDNVSTWTTLDYIFSWSNSIVAWNNYSINIANIGPVPSTIWSYWVSVNFYLWTSLIKTINKLYYIKWDSSLATNVWNSIEVYSWGITYPNNISGENSWDNNINSFSNLVSWSWSFEYISEMPVTNINFWVNWKLFNINYLYYKNYDCINWKHVLKEKNYIKFMD